MECVGDIALNLRESVQSADGNELRLLSADFADDHRFQNLLFTTDCVYQHGCNARSVVILFVPSPHVSHEV